MLFISLQLLLLLRLRPLLLLQPLLVLLLLLLQPLLQSLLLVLPLLLLLLLQRLQLCLGLRPSSAASCCPFLMLLTSHQTQRDLRRRCSTSATLMHEDRGR